MLKPKFVTFETDRHGKQKCYFRRGRGERIRLPLDMSSQEFRDAYAAAFYKLPSPHVTELPTTAQMRRKQRVGDQLKSNIKRAKTRAKEKGLDIDITLDWALDRAEANDLKCEVTGIPFFTESGCSSYHDPFSPSFDRIDNNKGYTQDNCRIVVLAINVMLNEWGPEIFERVANAYRYQKQSKRKMSA